MRLTTSLSFRLALTYAALFVASVLALSGLYYWLGIHRPLAAMRSQVEAESRTLASIYMRGGARAVVPALEERAGAPSPSLAYHALLNPSGGAIATNLPSWPHIHQGKWLRIDADISQEGEEDDYEALILDRPLPDGARLLVGRDIEHLDELEEALAETAGALLPALLLLVAIGGFMMSRAIGHRIEAVDAAARRVMAGDLSQRIPVRGTGDDFDRLSETLNLMLARIEGSVEAVRRVSDSVAHELRTPLARLQAELNELEAELPPAKHERVGRAAEEAERLSRMFNGVLRISRIEAGRHSATAEPVDLSSLVLDCAEFYQPAAEEKELELVTEVASPLVIRGDADLLFQAVGNILDNAIKFTPAGGRIHLVAEEGSGGAWIEISDTGPGIPEDLLDRVTERFFRAPVAAPTPGFGLGLSLVAAIAASHGATLTFLSAGSGLTVRLIFPVLHRRPPQQQRSDHKQTIC